MVYMYDSIEIQAIILAVKNIKVADESSGKIILKSISYLWSNYEVTLKEEFLQKALWHIYAYIEMGFSYEDGKETFQRILDYYQLCLTDLVRGITHNCEKIVLSKTNVRNILGRWNPRLHSMKIEEVVNDIISKVSGKMEGEYLYHCGKTVEEHDDHILWEHTYKLFVGKNDIFFQDVNRSKCYVFKEKK